MENGKNVLLITNNATSFASDVEIKDNSLLHLSLPLENYLASTAVLVPSNILYRQVTLKNSEVYLRLFDLNC